MQEFLLMNHDFYICILTINICGARNRGGVIKFYKRLQTIRAENSFVEKFKYVVDVSKFEPKNKIFRSFKYPATL